MGVQGVRQRGGRWGCRSVIPCVWKAAGRPGRRALIRQAGRSGTGSICSSSFYSERFEGLCMGIARPNVHARGRARSFGLASFPRPVEMEGPPCPSGGPRSPSPVVRLDTGRLRRRDRFTLATASAAPPMPQSTGRQQDGGASWLMSAAKVYVYIHTKMDRESRVSGRRLCVGSSVRRFVGWSQRRPVRLDRDRSSACFGIAGWALSARWIDRLIDRWIDESASIEIEM